MEKEKELLHLIAVERRKMLTCIKFLESVTEESKLNHSAALTSKILDFENSAEEIKKAINNYLNK